MTQPACATHEAGGFLHYELGSGPSLDSFLDLCKAVNDTPLTDTRWQTTVAGEQIQFEITTSKSKIEARPRDQVAGSTLPELPVSINGEGRRNAQITLKPRFDGQYTQNHHSFSRAWNQYNAGAGVAAQYQGSNFGMEAYPQLLTRGIAEFIERQAPDNELLVDCPFNGYIYEQERYVRIDDTAVREFVRPDGVFDSLYEACKETTDISCNHTQHGSIRNVARLSASELQTLGVDLPMDIGCQLKLYYPQYPDAAEADGPLIYPKLCVKFERTLSDSSTAWTDRNMLQQTLDELLLSLLDWGQVSFGDPSLRSSPESTGIDDELPTASLADRFEVATNASGTFLPDSHYHPGPRETSVTVHENPLETRKATQKERFLTKLSSLTDSGRAVLQTLVEDGPSEVTAIAKTIGRSRSTVYNVCNRLEDVVSRENGTVEFAARHLERTASRLLEGGSLDVTTDSDSTRDYLEREIAGASHEAFKTWCEVYDADLLNGESVEEADAIRIDRILSQAKSTSDPHWPTVIRELAHTLDRVGYNITKLRDLQVVFTVGDNDLTQQRGPLADLYRVAK